MFAYRLPLTAIALLGTLSFAPPVRAVGEAKGGFPNWAERVEHEWTNRARVDPAYEMAKCGTTKCPDGGCYSPKPPLYWSEWHGHAARFHSVHMTKNGYFSHDSNCKLSTALKTTYPTSCNGEASCSCAGAGTTSSSARVAIFASSYGGEIIASPTDPNSAFYLWLHEPTSSSTCAFSLANGHRWLLLTANGAVGFGVDGKSTGNFGSGGDVHKIPSAAHYPRSGASIEIWANWYDTAAPKSAQVNVAGSCKAMTLTRGTGTNGAWLHTATGLSGCVRYYLVFEDASGAKIEYPTTGSLGIGDASCADWDATRPPACGTTCTPSCTGKACGPDGCGGSCGACPSTHTCTSAGACVPKIADAGVDTSFFDAKEPADATPSDAATPSDVATPSDSASPDPDAAIEDGASEDAPVDDAAIDGAPIEDGTVADDASSSDGALASDAPLEGSCSCELPGRTRAPEVPWALLALVVSLARRRRLG